MSSTSTDSTTLRYKVFGEKKKKNSCKLQKVKLEFAAESNYLHNIDTILGITSNLETI